MVEIQIGDDILTLAWDEWEVRVRDGRVPPSALVRFEPATGERWVRAEELELYQSLRNDAAADLKARFDAAPPLLTALLVGVQIKLWWLAWWVPEIQTVVVRDFTVFLPAVLEDGQAWRLLTMGLSHTAAFHLFMNILWLFYCGWNLERLLGRWNLLTIFGGSVVVGSVLSMFGGPDSPSLGSSGGVYGLVSASIVVGFTRPHLLPERGRRLFGWALLPYLAIMFASGLLSETTDNWAHFGGLVTGVLLGAMLDPPSLQRRPRWNLGWYGVFGGGSLAALLAFALAGPRLIPLDDPRAMLEEAPLRWSVPAGWRAGRNAAGKLAWESPAGPRSWSVVEREESFPVPLDDLRTSWLVNLEEVWPDAEVTELDDLELAEEPALGARVLLDDASGGPRVLETRFAVRGMWTLTTTWEVDLARERRLEPLHRRLARSVTWEMPEDFESARISVEHAPDSPKARDAWARELARVGRVDEALDIRRELVEEFPDAVKWWSGMLDLIAWYPDAVPDREDVWQAALDAHHTGAMAAAVAASLDAVGEKEAALGLLDLAWVELPGERSVRRVRRRQDLSVAFDEAGEPWGLTHDPVTGDPRPPEAVEALRDRPWTLDEARARGATLVAERRAVIRAAAEALGAGELDVAIDRVGWLRQGTSDLDPEERDRVHEELHRAATSDHAPSWMPGEVVTAARANPPPPPPDRSD